MIVLRVLGRVLGWILKPIAWILTWTILLCWPAILYYAAWFLIFEMI